MTAASWGTSTRATSAKRDSSASPASTECCEEVGNARANVGCGAGLSRSARRVSALPQLPLRCSLPDIVGCPNRRSSLFTTSPATCWCVRRSHRGTVQTSQSHSSPTTSRQAARADFRCGPARRVAAARFSSVNSWSTGTASAVPGSTLPACAIHSGSGSRGPRLQRLWSPPPDPNSCASRRRTIVATRARSR